MNYKEVQGDLFKGLRERDGLVESLTDTKEVYCHCIANDGKWGAGIAPVFIDKIFKSRHWLQSALAKNPWNGHGKVIVGQNYNLDNSNFVFDANLITKEFTFGKPTYKTLQESLENLKKYIIDFNTNSPDKTCLIKYIKMPKIGCGLDGLNWDKVSEIVKNTFHDMDIDIIVYYL